MKMANEIGSIWFRFYHYASSVCFIINCMRIVLHVIRATLEQNDG